MKLLFVNQSHPEIAHVSGMRVSLLAREMARRGHGVVLLTSTLSDGDLASPAAGQLARVLAEHDWSSPCHVAVPPRADAMLRAAREASVPVAARRAITFYYQVRHLGVFDDWYAGCTPFVEALAAAWRADVVWGTFGNSTILKLTQKIAKRLGAPWLIDFKDSWDAFVHPRLRRYLAWRFGDAVAATANAEFTRAIASRWFEGLPTSVIYSGVEDAFFEAFAGDAGTPASEFLLIGGTYNEARLREFLAAFAAWLRAKPRERVRFAYLGTDRARVERVVAEVAPPCDVDVQAFVGIAAMAARCRRAAACCYLKHGETFHHKLLELLVSGRPVICFPGETAESLALGRAFKTQLFSCDTPEALEQAFSAAWRARDEPPAASGRTPWSWAARAAELEGAFEAALAGRSAMLGKGHRP